MNTLVMTDKLQAAGVPEKQARAHIEVLQDATAGLATTADLREMEARLRACIAEQTASLSKLLVTALVAAVAIFAMIVKLL